MKNIMNDIIHNTQDMLANKTNVMNVGMDDRLQVKMLIEKFPYSLSRENHPKYGRILERDKKLLWKDFLLCFKWGYSKILGEFFSTKTLSEILRELLHIDQEMDVRKSKKLTFQEWVEKY